MGASPAEITILLKAWSGGDEAALARLAERVYPELRLMARRHMRNERRGHTLQATASRSEHSRRFHYSGAKRKYVCFLASRCSPQSLQHSPTMNAAAVGPPREAAHPKTLDDPGLVCVIAVTCEAATQRAQCLIEI